MYTTFNLKIDLGDIIFLSSEELSQYVKVGYERKKLSSQPLEVV